MLWLMEAKHFPRSEAHWQSGQDKAGTTRAVCLAPRLPQTQNHAVNVELSALR
jgi:hypothetical protein